MIKLELSIEETNYVLKVLNNLPTESNVWPLVQKIKEQAIPQTQETKPEQS